MCFALGGGSNDYLYMSFSISSLVVVHFFIKTPNISFTKQIKQGIVDDKALTTVSYIYSHYNFAVVIHHKGRDSSF